MSQGFLHRYPFPNETVKIRGQVEVERTARGIRPIRFPAWTRSEHREELMVWDANATAGVRLVFNTSARAVTLEVLCTRLDLAWTGLAPAVFELVIGTDFVVRARSRGGDVLGIREDGSTTRMEGDIERIEFTGLPAGEKTVELWLPHSAGCELIAISADCPIGPPPDGPSPLTWLHYGSSISHCLEVKNPRQTWPAISAQLAGVESINLGMAGNAVLDPFVARTIRDTAADIISLKVGINILIGRLMKPRVFVPAVHGFLDTVREGHPETPIFLISPIACPQLEGTDSGPASDSDGFPLLTIEFVRDALHGIVEQRAESGLFYLDGRTLLGLESSKNLPDGLHPDAAGYQLMGERFSRELRRVLARL